MSSYLISLLLLLLLAPTRGRVCNGTTDESTVVDQNYYRRYLELRKRYSNCTVILGNLEIIWFPDYSQDFDFLRQIEEVTGYVNVKHVNAERISLPNLRIIRGRTTYLNEFGLFVSRTQIKRLELPSLREIVSGSVGLYNNVWLCNLGSINWDELISSGNHTFYEENGVSENNCVECDGSCDHGCWGYRPDDCQQLSRVTCAGQCWQGRCFGPHPKHCCHAWCAGGCTGPSVNECLACKYFDDDGVCVLECPMTQMYNKKTRSWETKRKYSYGSKCVRECPKDTLIDADTCVLSCPHDKVAVNGECVKVCKGDWVIHSGNLEAFRGCNKIEGYINIWDVTFQGFQDINFDSSLGPMHEPVHPNRLNIFNSVREITGSLNVRAYHPDFKDLSFLRNLEAVGALMISQTSLVSLGLNSLRIVHPNIVKISENEHLCYADTVNWSRLKHSCEKECFLTYNKDKSSCVREGLVCHEQCSEDGCWGPGSNQCLSCKNFTLNNTCVDNCRSYPGFHEDSKTKACVPSFYN